MTKLYFISLLVGLSFFLKAQPINTQKSSMYLKKANEYNDKEIYKKALKFYLKAYKIDSNALSDEDLNKVGLIYIDYKKDINQGVHYFNKVLKNNPKDTMAFLGIGYSCLFSDKYRDAIPYFEKAIEYSKQYANSYFGLGMTYSLLSEHEKALYYYLKGIEIDPSANKIYMNIAISYMRLGNEEQQIIWLKKAAKVGDKQAQDWLSKNGHEW
ncbi:MAG: tetratricopeptide repeat protein [Bacteroidales bacterium]|mgnify:CR=1 FL=1|nr:tetratricopeptide repeat protein [Bacteroidales bacterium]